MTLDISSKSRATLVRSSAGNLTKFGPQPASLLTSWYLRFFSL
jgi:hypothetical protein